LQASCHYADKIQFLVSTGILGFLQEYARKKLAKFGFIHCFGRWIYILFIMSMNMDILGKAGHSDMSVPCRQTVDAAGRLSAPSRAE
jgi:hypothetical protein